MKSLQESLFDDDLVQKELPIMIKHKFVKKLEELLKKYNVPFEIHIDRKGTETYCISLEKIFNNAVNINNKYYDYKVFIHPNITFPRDEYFGKIDWQGKSSVKGETLKIHPINLWFQIWKSIKSAGEYIGDKLSIKYNKYKIIPSIDGQGDFEDEERLDNYLKRIEELIKRFNSKDFSNEVTNIILKQNSSPITSRQMDKLVKML